MFDHSRNFCFGPKKNILFGIISSIFPSLNLWMLSKVNLGILMVVLSFVAWGSLEVFVRLLLVLVNM